MAHKTTRQLQIAGYTIELTRKKVRRINLRLYGPDAAIRVSAPHYCTDAEIREFVGSKLAWLEKHIKLYCLQQRVTAPDYVHGAEIHLQGRRYTLNVLEDASLNRIVMRDGGTIDMHIKPGTSQEKRLILIYKWQRALLEARIAPLLSKWQEKLVVEVNTWAVKRMKTRWGSCSIVAKRIWINLELAKRSDYCLEYIIVHELAHLLEKGHGQAFHALMDRFLPDWRDRERELKLLPDNVV